MKHEKAMLREVGELLDAINWLAYDPLYWVPQKEVIYRILNQELLILQKELAKSEN